MPERSRPPELEDVVRLAGAKARGKRPVFFRDPDVERVLSIVMAVAGEVAVLRQRLDTIEALLDARGSISREDIESFEPTAERQAERGRWTEEYLARILRIVQQEIEALGTDEPTSEEAGNTMVDE